MTPDRAHNLPDDDALKVFCPYCGQEAGKRCIPRLYSPGKVCARSHAARKEAMLNEHAAMLVSCEWDAAILQEEA